MIVLFTDFGPSGPYVGQMRTAIAKYAPSEIAIDLLSDAPAFNPKASAYLLAALAPDFPDGAIFLCVVDPGVGGDRLPLIVKAKNQVFIGPDNGLFSIVARRSSTASVQKITWKPDYLSASFHGRDLFAPVAAMISTGKTDISEPISKDTLAKPDWPDDLKSIIYIDHFGNAMTGIRAKTLSATTRLEWCGNKFSYAKTFSSVESGAAFWYENANGLAEISINQGRADDLGLAVGEPISILAP
ncbi:MAG: SAM hydrolase/SAM-dependent halogenase family protein [Alphaproteobacteria bacterium]|jgi:S-adenosylmethionine hydrolase